MRLVLAVFGVAALAGAAAAEPSRALVVTPPEAFTPTGAQISPFLYLNRCIGGCTVTGGNVNNAQMHQTSIPAAGTYHIQEFQNSFGQIGSAGTCIDGTSTPCTTDAECNGAHCDTADAQWAAIVQCMKEVYSPYAVTVSDTPPPPGTSYTEAVIAGFPADLGQATDVLGIAPLASNCAPQDNVMSFSFANHHAPTDRVFNVCWTAAQESAHAFGLDHEYQFVDGSSACSDPMTYRVDCGGEKFFRNAKASCGEYAVRNCRCSTTQNSHQKVLAVFGPGQSSIAAPTADIVYPAGGAQLATGDVVHANAGSQRGVAKVELWLNGSKWSEVKGAAFGASGQATPSSYTLPIPATVPNSILDLVVKAYDDLGLETDSATVTVEKGTPCTTAATCLTDQKCDNGHCYWDPPTGELGADCSYAQFCKSWECLDIGGGSQCTQDCTINEDGSCPAGYTCQQVSSREICVATGGGCCSAAGDGGAGWTHVGLGALVLGLVRRRRRS